MDQWIVFDSDIVCSLTSTAPAPPSTSEICASIPESAPWVVGLLPPNKQFPDMTHIHPYSLLYGGRNVDNQAMPHNYPAGPWF